MEMGLGFMIGLLAGTVVAVVGAMIIFIARKAVRSAPSAAATEMRALADTTPLQGLAKPAKAGGGLDLNPAARSGRSDPSSSQNAADRNSQRRNTIVIEQVELRDRQFTKSVQDIRELLLRLADVIATTETASGEAAAAFNSARKTIDNIDSDDNADLSEAQRVLIGEIDRVIKSNAKLQGELDKANQGIVEQRRQIEELRVQARIDALTRISNRTAFDERLQEYIALLNRNRLTFTLLLMDIDYFKKVNDEHGHVNGDRILRGVASRIADGVRTNDFPARYGGEEFAVIFPGSGVKDAYIVADRIRKDISKTNFRLDEKTIRMTISGGMAECKQGMKAEQIIAKADDALYRAKNGGRNQVLIDGMEAPAPAAAE